MNYKNKPLTKEDKIEEDEGEETNAQNKDKEEVEEIDEKEENEEKEVKEDGDGKEEVDLRIFSPTQKDVSFSKINIRFHTYYSDNMVFQRNVKNNVWGYIDKDSGRVSAIYKCKLVEELFYFP